MLSVFSDSNYSMHIPGSPTCFSIPQNVSGLTCLSHEVASLGSCRRIFNGSISNLKIDNGLSCPLSIPSPAISGASVFCSSQPLTFTGALSGFTATSHFWEIVQCNSVGVVTPGGYSWSTWNTGHPGVFTFPVNSMPPIPCDNYFRIKLAISTPCFNWVETSRVIRINCTPVADVGHNRAICIGDCITLNAPGPTAGLLYTWTYLGDEPFVIGTGQSVTVCPTINSTYCVTVKNIQTGCSAYDCLNIVVLNNTPDFTFSNVQSFNGYCTLNANPIVTNVSGIPGFLATWRIEEIDQFGTVISPAFSTNCWASSLTCNFNKFDGPYYSLNGSFNPAATCINPNPGKFTTNRRYKITRTVNSASCPPKSFSLIFNCSAQPEPSAMPIINIDRDNSHEVDNLSMDASEVHDQEDLIAISPNPSTGIFTVNLSNSSKGIMEVYDVLGNKVKEILLKENTSQYQLDLTNQAKGVYLLHITTDGKKQFEKIIIE